MSMRKNNLFLQACCAVRYDNIGIHEQYLDHSLHKLVHESQTECVLFLEFLHSQLGSEQTYYNTKHVTTSFQVAAHSVNLTSFPFATSKKPDNHADTGTHRVPRPCAGDQSRDKRSRSSDRSYSQSKVPSNDTRRET